MANSNSLPWFRSNVSPKILVFRVGILEELGLCTHQWVNHLWVHRRLLFWGGAWSEEVVTEVETWEGLVLLPTPNPTSASRMPAGCQQPSSPMRFLPWSQQTGTESSETWTKVNFSSLNCEWWVLHPSEKKVAKNSPVFYTIFYWVFFFSE